MLAFILFTFSSIVRDSKEFSNSSEKNEQKKNRIFNRFRNNEDECGSSFYVHHSLNINGVHTIRFLHLFFFFCVWFNDSLNFINQLKLKVSLQHLFSFSLSLHHIHIHFNPLYGLRAQNSRFFFLSKRKKKIATKLEIIIKKKEKQTRN